MTNGDQSVTAWGGTYETAANLFRSINFLHFTSMFQWSWLLGLIMTVGVFFMLLRLPEPDPHCPGWHAARHYRCDEPLERRPGTMTRPVSNV